MFSGKTWPTLPEPTDQNYCHKGGRSELMSYTLI